MSKRISLRDKEVERLNALLLKEIREIDGEAAKISKLRNEKDFVSATLLKAFDECITDLRELHSIANKVKDAEVI